MKIQINKHNIIEEMAVHSNHPHLNKTYPKNKETRNNLSNEIRKERTHGDNLTKYTGDSKHGTEHRNYAAALSSNGGAHGSTLSNTFKGMPPAEALDKQIGILQNNRYVESPQKL